MICGDKTTTRGRIDFVRPGRESYSPLLYTHNNKHGDKTLLLLLLLYYYVAGGEYISTTTRVISVYLHRERREPNAFPAVPAAAQTIYILYYGIYIF